MIKSIRHIGIVTKDMNQSLIFWKSLGFKPYYHQVEIWGKKTIEVAKLKLNDDIIELIKGNWRNHIALTVDDIEKYRGMLNRTKVIQRPTGHKIILALSPESMLIEFVEEPK